MHCFICVTYLMIIATAHPPKDREISKTHDKRSIFNDVIQSLLMRSQIPDDMKINDENNIGQSYDGYGIESDSLQLPSDLDFLPRRNDRIEMPPMKYRFPKSIEANESDVENTKEEIILYVNTPVEYTEPKPTTQKPKKQKPPRPSTNKNKNTIAQKDEDNTETGTNDRPLMNNMAGQSQIGNRESQTVVKPTVIVNFRGSVMHRESDIRLQRRTDNETMIPQNIFNINQEIKVERTDTGMGSTGMKKSQENLKANKEEGKKTIVEEDMMMCETSSSKEKDVNDRSGRKYDVLQILFTV